MKRFTKFFIMVMALVFSVFTMVGCTNNKSLADKMADGDVINIGIQQFATFSALDAATLGIQDELADAGYADGDGANITILNCELDNQVKGAQATTLVRDNDIVFGVATPCGVALQNAAKQEQIDLPILFTAVTDPVDASLVTSNETPGANVTGTTDMNPVNEQFDMLVELFAANDGKNLTKLGIIYNVTEDNSKIQADLIQATAEAAGVEVEIETVNNDAGEIVGHVHKLISDGCDAIYVPTDNLMSQNMGIIATSADEAGVVTLCGEEGQVSNGGTISYSIDYYNLGRLTAKMGLEIMNGADPATMAVRALDVEQLKFCFNETSLENIGFILPEDLQN